MRTVNRTTDVVIAELRASRILPVVVIDDSAHAVELASALADGGVRSAEFTLRTPAALDGIRRVRDIDGFIPGAGTVLTTQQVDACADAGARFIVSPGFDIAVVERALERGLLPIPGVATATEIQAALRCELVAVKFFPAEHLGGIAALKTFSQPFPGLQFVPSGGIDAGNVESYLRHEFVLAAAGSWMVPRSAIARADFAAITQLTLLATQLSRRPAQS